MRRVRCVASYESHARSAEQCLTPLNAAVLHESTICVSEWRFSWYNCRCRLSLTAKPPLRFTFQIKQAAPQAAASEAGAEHALTTLWCHVLLLHALLPPPPAAPDDIALHQTLVQGPPPRGLH